MIIERVLHLSCFICTVIYSVVILIFFLPLQLCETVENYTVSLQSFAWLYGNTT